MKSLAFFAVVAASGIAGADVWPHVFGDMKHVMIGVNNGAITAHADTAPGERLEMLNFPGESYSGAAGVLDGTWYNSQYGWLAAGFISLAPGERIMIENTSMDAGLSVYLGGMRMMNATHTYAPIFGTDGSPSTSEWAGTMRHDWFAADGLGDYDATFRIFVADAAGAQVTSYGDAEVTLLLRAVPAPGGGAALALGGAVLSRRRREGGRR